MAVSQTSTPLSVEAGSAVTIARYLMMATDKQVDHSGNAGRIDGIASETQATVGGAVGMIVPDGRIAVVEAGAAFSAGATLQSDASGRAITAVSGAGNWTGGIAIDAAGAAGELVRILFSVDLDQA
jgi:uncharacterized protein DUF2190